jgi:acid phosphatase class B
MPKPIVTFDFDDTLCMEDGTPNFAMMNLVHKHAAEGCKCYIVTARNKAHESVKWINKNGGTRIRVKDFIKDHQLPIKQCHFTNHEPKSDVLKLHNVIMHYDNCDEVLKELKDKNIPCQKALV